MRDRLIFELDGKRFALETSEVSKVVEVERLSYLPGQDGIVSGVVSLGGEPVTVVDARRALALPAGELVQEGPRKVVVMRSGSKTLGLDIGAVSVAFEWEKKPEGEDEAAGGNEAEMDNAPSVATDRDQNFEEEAPQEQEAPGAESAGDESVVDESVGDENVEADSVGDESPEDESVEMIDWHELFNEAVRILEGAGA